MAASKTYSGVYAKEIQSGVRTITGVSKSITAFVGRTLLGLPNVPRIVSSYSEFESDFGAQDGTYALGHAVGDFFMNGGCQALIVGVCNDNCPPGGLLGNEAGYGEAFDALRKTDMFNLLCLPPANPGGDVILMGRSF
jgi:hypothetical protein